MLEAGRLGDRFIRTGRQRPAPGAFAVIFRNHDPHPGQILTAWFTREGGAAGGLGLQPRG